MTTDPITELEAMIAALWDRVGLGQRRAVRLQTDRQDDGSPHVEFVDGRYHIVTTERGRETDRIPGQTLEQAARWFVFWKAEGRALKMEQESRRAPHGTAMISPGLKDDGYSRWNWMAPTILTMDQISPDLGEWCRRYYSNILEEAPLTAYERQNARWPLNLKNADRAKGQGVE